MLRKETGRHGEIIASNYLKNKGYRILSRNYRCRDGEIDIICEKEHILIFVEVKSRRNTDFGYPEESVTKQKIQHIKKVALNYLNKDSNSYKEIRFDVIGIIFTDDSYNINHVEAAF